MTCVQGTIYTAMAFLSVLLLTVLLPAFVFSSIDHYGEYYLGEQGQSCHEVCGKRNLICNPRIVTGGNTEIFQKLGIGCKTDSRNWWAHDQPCYVNDVSDGNYGRCLGYTNVPNTVNCGNRFRTVRRLCRCQEPFILGNQGEDCTSACSRYGRQCSSDYSSVHGSVEKFFELGVSCKPDYRYWWANDQPCYVSSSSDGNYRKCLGFTAIPSVVPCSGKYWSVRRLCNCYYQGI